MSSNILACLENPACSSGVQNPITFSTPARLYHDRLVVVLVVDRVAVRACPECL